MVDEYTGANTRNFVKKEVQIPLWSMNTFDADADYLDETCSDSSMVDEYSARSRSCCD